MKSYTYVTCKNMSNSSVIGSNNIPSCTSAEGSNVAIPGAVPGEESRPGHQIQQPDRMMPVGLQALYSACMKVYPEQPNPLQVTTRLKYWLGGHDPLDYISMYWNPGRPEENIPPHWHYVSFGLSDLHGDGRVHPEPGPGTEGSGYGIELTFRLAAEPREPPLWPAALLQSLARYVFTTGNKFCAGDHISWHSPLDGSKSRIRHLLVAADPQLGTVPTPHGSVSFVQIVGCTNRELKATQRGSGFDVLKTIAEDPGCGGAWLVTEVRRGSARRVRTAPAARPADLAGVTANVCWRRYVPSAEDEEQLSPSVERQIKETLQRGLSVMSDRGAEGHNMSTDSFEMSSLERALPPPSPPPLLHDAMDMSTSGSWRGGGGGCGGGDVQYLDGVHLILDAEAASLLPLAIDGRVLHSRHFTWRRAGGGGGGEGGAVTLVPPAVAGAFVTPDRPYAARAGWLQVLIPEDLARDMSAQARELARLAGADSESEDEAPPPPALPLTLRWPRRRLQLTVRSAEL